MPISSEKNNPTLFPSGIRVGNVNIDSSETNFGLIRYNTTRNRFEGLHKTAGAGPGGSDNDDMSSVWREFTSDIASSSKVGGIKVGTNLTVNPTTGILSSVATGESRIYQQIITVSDNVGSGDYQSITTAITNALGTSPDFDDGSITTSNGAPSLTNQYIIQVSPGVYQERVNLPSYVSLRGEGTNITYIKSVKGGSSVQNSALITAGSTSTIENLTLDLNSSSEDYITGIYSSSNSNISIRNVNVVDSGSSSGTASYGIYLSGGSGHKITEYDTTLDLGSTAVYGGYITNTNPYIDNNKVSITANTTNNYGFYFDTMSSSGTDVKNSEITVSGASNNYGIYHNNALSTTRFSRIIVDGDTNNSTDTAYGIVGNSSTTSANITSNKLEFIANSNAKDVIYLTDTSSNNFSTDGFKEGMIITVSGSSNNNNNYTINQVQANTLVLSENDTLTSEGAGSSITIKQLYTINIEHSHINATSNGTALSNSIAVLSSSGNYAINSYSTSLLGGHPNANSSVIRFNTDKVITVGGEGADFYLLSEAMNSISDNDSERRYIIQIQSGNYVENSQITCKRYVSIYGSGPKNTTITFDIANATEANASTLVLNSDMDIENLTIKNITTSGTSKSIGLYATSKSNINLTNCRIELSGTAQTKYGLYFISSTYQTSRCEVVVSAGASSITNYGIYQTGSTAITETTEITVSGTSSTLNQAIYNSDTNLFSINPKISVSGSSTANKGISGTSTTLTDYIIQVQSGEVLVSGSGNKSLILDDDNYSIIATTVRLEGDVEFTDTNTDTNVKCINCYKLTGTSSLTFTPLNIRGEDDASNLSLIQGDGAGNQGSTGTKNTLYGINAGNALTSGSRNVFIGDNTGKLITIADDNTFVGSGAGVNATIADNNSLFGSNSGMRLSTGVNNTIIGRNAGYDMTIASYNTIIGESSGYLMTNATDNVFVGQGTGFNTTSGSQCVFIGGGSSSNIGAGYSNTTGINNTYVGFQSGKSSTTSNDNTAVGYLSGYSNIGADNTNIGSEAGYNQTTGTENTNIGRKAGYGDSGGATGNYNTSVGSNTCVSMTSGSFNSVFGRGAGYSLTTGTRNVLIGSSSSIGGTDSAGYSLSIGSDCVYIGVKAGNNSTSSVNNICIGSNSGGRISTGVDNVLIGSEAGRSILTTKDNLFLGRNAGKNYQGSSSIMIGNYAGEKSTSNASTFIGVYAGRNMVGAHNTFIGYEAGKAQNATGLGTHNLAIGAYVARKIDGGSRNIILGSGDMDAGESTASQLDDGNDNVLIGYKAAKGLIDGSQNIAIGSETGKSMTDALANILIGYRAGYTETSGDYSIMIGYEAGYNQNNVSKNIFQGYRAGYTNTSGTDLIAIGTNAGYLGNTASKNISIGTDAGYNTTGSNNINFGFQAGKANTTGTNSIYFGYRSGGYGTTGTNNTGDYNLCVGNETGYSLTSGARNIFVGNQTGRSMTTGSKCILMGNYAGYASTTTSKNIFIGMTDSDSHGVGHTSSGQENIGIGSNVFISLSSGAKNIAIGREAGELLTTGDQNIHVGYRAGEQTTIGDNNINIGTNTGRYNTTGNRNIFIGYNTGGDSALGVNNVDNVVIGSDAGTKVQIDELVLIGKSAGMLTTTGAENIFIGPDAGRNNTTGGQNIFIGSDAGLANTTTSKNICVGHQSGKSITSGNNNIFIGYKAGEDNTTGVNNVVLGTEAFKDGIASNVVIIGFECGQASTVDDSILIGSQAGKALTSGPQNIFIGRQAGTSTTTGNTNIFIGAQAGYTASSAYQNICIGKESGYLLDSGYRNVCIGYNTGYSLTSGNQNTAIGDLAGYSLSSGVNNVLVGRNAGYTTSTGDHNVIMGTSAGRYNISGNQNIYIGLQSGYNNETGSNNIFIGRDAGLTTTVSNNIYIGSYSAYNATTAINNLFIGYESGFKTTTGGGNIYMGYKSGNKGTIGTENINVGYYSGYTNVSGKHNLNIGYEAGYASTTDNNINIGYRAGRSTSTGVGNLFMGVESGRINTDGYYNIGIGHQTLYNFNDNYVASGERGYNIAIGFQAGSNIGINTSLADNGAPFKNTIIGFSAVKTGDINQNNVMMGSNVGLNVNNPRNFANNTMIGSETGKTSNLSFDSIAIGSSVLETGTGGEANILMGKNTGKIIGNPVEKYGTLDRIANSGDNYFILNMPFGSGGYYYKIDDTIIINPTSGASGEFVISMIETFDNGSRTKIVLTTALSSNFASGSEVYVKMKNDINIGKGDNTKASSNTMMGNNSGFSATTASKNNALGVNAMYSNQIGKYNNIIGADAGYNTKTDHNTLLGTKAGYNVDSYNDSSLTKTGTGFNFHSSNNTMKSSLTDISGYKIGTVIDITGSSVNDGRYIISTSNVNSIKFEGFPKLEEDGVPDTISGDALVLDRNNWNYYNDTLTASTISFTDTSRFINASTGLFGDLINVPERTSNYSKILKISGSKFNDGYYYFLTNTENTTNKKIILANDYSIFSEDVGSSITLSTVNISHFPEASGQNSINFRDIKPNHLVYIYYGDQKGTYRHLDYTPLINTNTNTSLYVNDITATTNQVNSLFAETMKKTGSISSFTQMTKDTSSYTVHGQTQFHSSNGVINFEGHVNGNQKTNGFSTGVLVKISGTTYNNGYYVIDSISGGNMFVNGDYTLVDENSNTTVFEVNTFTNLTNPDNIFSENDIVNIYTDRLGDHNNQGAYIVDKMNKDSMIINDNIELFTNYQNLTIGAGNSETVFANKDLYNVSRTDNLVQGNDIIFQNKSLTTTVSFNVNDGNDMSSTHHSNIVSATDYTFKNIIAPVVIKISNSSNNNKYYLVKRNKHPFNTLELDPQTPLTAESSNEITININSVSSYLKLNDLSGYLESDTLRVLGSRKNNDTSLTIASSYGSVSPVFNDSIYLSTTVSNENGNKVGLMIVPKTNSSGTATYKFSKDNGEASNSNSSATLYFNGYFKQVIFNSTSNDGDYPFVNYSLPVDGVPIKSEILPSGGSECLVKVHTNYSDDSNASGFFSSIHERGYITVSGSDNITNNGTYVVSNKALTTSGNGAQLMTLTLQGSNAGSVSVGENTIDNSSLKIGVNQFVFANAGTNELDTAQDIYYHFGKNADYLGFSKYNSTYYTLSQNTLVYNTSFDRISGDGWTTSGYSNVGIKTFNIPRDYTFSASGASPTNRKYSIELATPTDDVDVPLSDNSGYISTIYGAYANSSDNKFGFSNHIFSTDDDIMYANGNIEFSTANGVIKVSSISLGVQNDNTYPTELIRNINSKKFSPIAKPFQHIREGMTIRVLSIDSANNSQNDGYYVVKTVYSNCSAIQVDREHQNLLNNNTMTFNRTNGIAVYPLKGIYSNRYDFNEFRNDSSASISSNQFSTANLGIMVFDKENAFYSSILDANNSLTEYNHNIIRDKTPIYDEFVSNSSYLADWGLETYQNYIGAGNHIILAPTSNLTSTSTNITFDRVVLGSGSVSFYNANSGIESSALNLNSFSVNQYINVSGTTNNDGYYQITNIVDDNNMIVSGSLTNETAGSTTLTTNTINSSNVSLTDLSDFNPGQYINISKTSNNNRNFQIVSNIAPNSYSLYVSNTIVSETPKFCRIEKSMVIDESNVVIGSSNLTFSTDNDKITSSGVKLNTFRTGQTITVSSTSSNNGDIIIGNADPTDTVIESSGVLANETNTSAKLEKKISIKKIGEPVSTTTSCASSILYHAQDAQGNNLMLGSFAGQFSGANSLCIHNTYIGNKVGQTNHGGGNLLLGSETDLASNASVGSTTYENKLAIYKTNFIGVPSKPLIGGDFSTGRVGINTITPENFTAYTDINDTDIKLVVNGGAWANSFSPFTGTHIFEFNNPNMINRIQSGMILTSSGKVKKHSVLNTTVKLNISDKVNDKRVFGVYSHSENVIENNNKQKKIMVNNEIVDNDNYKEWSDYKHYCASVGEGCILVCDINGEIENGDYITTSDIIGIGMKQDNDMLMNYTVAKSTEDIDWNSIGNYIKFNGIKYKYSLIGCTYHCG